jgi:hypothetical protein
MDLTINPESSVATLVRSPMLIAIQQLLNTTQGSVELAKKTAYASSKTLPPRDSCVHDIHAELPTRISYFRHNGRFLR